MSGSTLPAMLTIAETAALLRVAPKLVRRLIGSGELRAVRLGRIYRIPSAAISALMGSAVPTATEAVVLSLPESIPPRGRPGRPRKKRRAVSVEPAGVTPPLPSSLPAR